jgi:uncharacterized protein DUF2190
LKKENDMAANSQGGPISRKIASLVTTPNRLVKPTGNPSEVDIVNAANTPFYGVITSLPRAAGEWTDIAISGLVSIEAGGTIADGNPLISDNVGRVVAMNVASATVKNCIGFAYGAATIGQFVSVMPAPKQVA